MAKKKSRLLLQPQHLLLLLQRLLLPLTLLPLRLLLHLLLLHLLLLPQLHLPLLLRSNLQLSVIRTSRS